MRQSIIFSYRSRGERPATHEIRPSPASCSALGKTMLGRRQVLPTVPSQLHEIQIEGTFHDGTFLVTVHEPISRKDGDLALALYGSFLPVPGLDAFGPSDSPETPELVPGQVVVSRKRSAPASSGSSASEDSAGSIKLNPGRERVRIKVTNNGDRPVQVGSHYHFSEANRQLEFDRGLALGKRLDIAAGTAVRFEPGEGKTVTLVAIAGNQIVTGGNNILKETFKNEVVSLKGIDMQALRDAFVKKVVGLGFAHRPQPGVAPSTDMKGFEMSREAYASIYGPTTGDRVRLGDSPLWVTVEKDLTSYGDECKFGGGVCLKMSQSAFVRRGRRCRLIKE